MEGLILATAYALACWLSRKLSYDEFFLSAGLRVSAFLLLPIRLWPYLLLGEYTYLAHIRYPLIEKYGVAWAILGSLFVAPVVALIVRMHRRLLESKADVWLFSVAATSSIAATAISLSMSYLLWPAHYSSPILEKAVRYFLGDLIGILALAPLALLWVKRDVEWRPSPKVVVTSIISLLLMLFLCALATQIPADDIMLKTTAHLLMVLPAIVLTRMHGWRGAAVSVPCLILFFGLTVVCAPGTTSPDPVTIRMHQFLVVVGGALLLLGFSITHYVQQYRRRERDHSMLVSLSRTSHLAGEMSLRRNAIQFSRIGDGIDAYLSDTADWLKHHGHHDIASNLIRTSALFSRKFREQASMVYPSALEHVGLYLALQVGGISDAWSSTDRVPQPRLVGDPCALSVTLQLATYRTLTEAASLLLAHERGQIRIHARCGRRAGRSGIVVVVALLDSGAFLSPSTVRTAVETLSGRALAYAGIVHCRRNRLRMLFVDPLEPQRLPA